MEEIPEIKEILSKLESSLPICRVCLEISMEYVEFEAPLCEVDGREITYLEGFMEIVSYFKDLPENLPRNLCTSCANDLFNAYLFIKRVECTNKVLEKVKHFDGLNSNLVEAMDEYISEGSTSKDFDNCIKIEPVENNLKNDLEYNINEMESFEPALKGELSLNEIQSSTEISYEFADSESTIEVDLEINESNTNTSEAHISTDISQICDDDCEKCYETPEKLNNHKEFEHNRNESIMTKCIQCDKMISEEQLENHLLCHQYCDIISTNFNEEIYKCTLCKQSCLSVEKFLQHVKLHTELKPYLCNYCSKEFHTKNNLALHKFRVHTSRSSLKRKKEKEKCFHCQTIIRRSQLNTHLETHSKINEPVCEKCELQFASDCVLETHSITHSNQSESTCNVCGKVYQRKWMLDKHIQFLHNKQSNERKKYQCEDCGLIFKYPSNLQDHQRKHNAKNRFKCPHCERTFCRKPQLHVHLRYHTNDFRYKCDKCHKRYVTKSNLMDHIRSRHTKETFDCDQCNQKFKSQTGLRKHKYVHTGYPYNCPLCSVGQTSRSGMKTHIFGVHKDAITEDEFNNMFPIIVPKTGFRRPKEFL